MPAPEVSRRITERLAELRERHAPLVPGSVHHYYGPGRGYYPAQEAGAEADLFAIAVSTCDGEVHGAGDDTTRFALQSISKVFAYALALEDRGRDEVLEHVGVEPSGDAYNSVVIDESRRRPYNPMINAGALVTADLVRGADPEEKHARLLDTMRRFAGNDALDVDDETFERELATADRNRATAYLMRSLGMIEGDVEEILALYLRQCSVTVTCRDLAVMGATLANGCVNPVTGERVPGARCVRDVLSVMYTCGMYDFAGQWVFEVGFPAKSGVSGATMAAIPGKLGVAVFSPGLDSYGSSVRGIAVCQELSDRLGLHLLAPDTEDAMLGDAPELETR